MGGSGHDVAKDSESTHNEDKRVGDKTDEIIVPGQIQGQSLVEGLLKHD